MHEVLGVLEPPVQRRPEPLRRDLVGSVEPRRQHRDGTLVGREEQAFLRSEVEEHGALGDAHVGGDVFDATAPVPVLGEVTHRRLDDPLAPLRRHPRAWPVPRSRSDMSRTVARQDDRSRRARCWPGPRGGEERARETSGSPGTEAPSHLVASRAQVPQATSAPVAVVTDRARRVRLARRRSDRLPLAGSPCGVPAAAGLPCGPPEGVPPGGRTLLRPCGVCLAREAPRPALRPSSAPRSSASGLAAFVGSPGSVSALRRLRNLVRSPRVGASTAWSEANCTGAARRWSTPTFPQVRA